MEKKEVFSVSTEKIRNFFTKNFILIIFCGVGILMVLFSNLFFTSSNSEKKVAADEKNEEGAAEYVMKITDELKRLIKNIEGVGSCEVMLTVESGPQHVYVSEEKNSEQKTEDTESGRMRIETKREGEETYVIINDQNGQRALIRTTLSPKIKGVVVLCSGADNPTVKLSVVNAVTTIFKIPSNRVCVIKIS